MTIQKMMTAFAAILLARIPLFAEDVPASGNLDIGTRLSWGTVGIVSDSERDYYTNGVGDAVTFSFDIAYRLSPKIYLHSGLGLDFRYFSSYVEMGNNCDGSCGGTWKGDESDALFYLEIPMLAQLRIPGILFLEAGPFVNVFLTKKEELVGPGRYLNNQCYDESLFGAGAALGIGHVFDNGFFIDLRLTYQFTDVADTERISLAQRLQLEENSREPDKWDGSYIMLNKLQLGIGYWF
jgi:hypothetical protein